MRLQVKVKPNARATSLEQLDDGCWYAQLKSPPVDGKANVELCALIAERFGVAKAKVVVKGGGAGRMKWVEIIDG